MPLVEITEGALRRDRGSARASLDATDEPYGFDHRGTERYTRRIHSCRPNGSPGPDRKALHPMLKDFKAFIMRGNVMDLAVGVIIGAAFGKIVSSLVGDVLMPALGLVLGGINFSGLRIRIGGTDASPINLAYGSFLQALVDFLFIALAVFLLIRIVGRLQKPAVEVPARTCPHCKQQIDLAATRCPHCTSQLT